MCEFYWSSFGGSNYVRVRCVYEHTEDLVKFGRMSGYIHKVLMDTLSV